MRVGILGPASGDLDALARAARVLRDVASVDRVLYVGDDDALDRVVEQMARELVGGDPAASSLYLRAAERCADATPDAIDEFVAREEQREALRMFAAVRPGSRTIEILDGRVVLFVHDKATLDEEDIVAASILVFGRSDAPLLRRVGTRVFVAPGAAGAAVLDDGDGGVRIELVSAQDGAVVATDHIGQNRGSKIVVQGGDG